MKRAIVTLIAFIVSLSAAVCALAVVFPLRRLQYSAAWDSGKIQATLLCAFVSMFLLWIAIGLFRFRRWALIATIIFAGLCSVYSLAKLLVIRPGANQTSTWFFLLSSVGAALFLIYVAPESTDAPAIQGSRPSGVTGMAIVGFACLPLGVLTIFRDIQIQSPDWQVASAVFNTMLCAVLSFGLWKLREWARLLTEVTGFLAPLGVLPILLGTSRYRPFFITMVVAVLIYAAWTIWYLRRPQVERVFVGSESIDL